MTQRSNTQQLPTVVQSRAKNEALLNASAGVVPSLSSQNLQAIFDDIPQPMWFMMGNEIFMNAAWRAYVCDISSDTRDWTQWLHPDDQISAGVLWGRAKCNESDSFEGMWRIRHSSQEARWCRVRGRLTKAVSQADATIWCISLSDAHEERHQLNLAADAIAKQASMLDASVDCIKILNLKGQLVHMNRSGCIALGVPVDEKDFGMDWLNLLPPSIRIRGKRALRIARHGKCSRFAGMSQMPGEKPVYWDNLLTPLFDEGGNVSSILCVSRNVTAQRTAELRLREASENDDLTGLFNRRAFNQHLRRLLRKVDEVDKNVGLLIFDLDHFKHINDTQGHQAGDQLLRCFARRLKSELPTEAIITRLGGDEFAVAIGPIAGEQTLRDVACLVMAQLEAPVPYQGHFIEASVSVGGAMYPRDAKDASSLLKTADTALHQRKLQGRGGFMLVDTRMRDAVSMSYSQLENARLVIAEGLVEPRYEPIYHLTQREVFGFEAKLFWRDKQYELKDASAIDEAFRDYQLASALGVQLQTRVFETIRRWQQAGFEVKPVSLQVHQVEFMGDNYAEGFLERLKNFGIDPHLVGISVSEQALIGRGVAYVARALELLRLQGVIVSLDGFGTGPASLTALHEYPVKALKIDGKLIKQANIDDSARVILKAIIQICQALKRSVIAMDISNVSERALLVWMGCTYGQGPYFGEPLNDSKAQEHMVQA